MRVMAIVGGLVFLLVWVRLLLATLQPLLPAGVVSLMAAGGQLIYGIMLPALPGAAALAILFAVWWITTGRR